MSLEGSTSLSSTVRATCTTVKGAWGLWEIAAGRSISKSHLLCSDNHYHCFEQTAQAVLQLNKLWHYYCNLKPQLTGFNRPLLMLHFTTGGLVIMASAPWSGATRTWAVPKDGTGGTGRSDQSRGWNVDFIKNLIGSIYFNFAHCYALCRKEKEIYAAVLHYISVHYTYQINIIMQWFFSGSQKNPPFKIKGTATQGIA